MEVGFEFGLELGFEFKFKCRFESAVNAEAEFQISMLKELVFVELVSEVAVLGELLKVVQDFALLSEMLFLLLLPLQLF